VIAAPRPSKTDRCVMRDCLANSVTRYAPRAVKALGKMCDLGLVSHRRSADGWFSVRVTKLAKKIATQNQKWLAP